MYHLHYTLLLLSMGVFPHRIESEMKRDTTVNLATVLNHVNVLESGLKSTMAALQTTRDDLEATNTELQEQKQHYSSMNRSLVALKSELALKTQTAAFSVYLESSVQSGSHLPVTFDGEHYNAGNGYNTTTGKFTAPVNGTYIFSTEVLVDGSSANTYIRIMQSGSAVSEGFGYTTKDYTDITIPVTVITHVRLGDQVWIDSNSDVLLYMETIMLHILLELSCPWTN